MFGVWNEYATGTERKLHDEKLQNLYACLHFYYKDDPAAVYLLTQG
jgi:Mlc titration factor MtfA (ptsG expression regulator)